MSAVPLTCEQLLAHIPQQQPFRFVDKIIEVDEQRIKGCYQFREDEFFYSGHFPGKPVTPGVILLESMCQVGVVALGIYLLSLQMEQPELDSWLTLFTDAQTDFSASVYPKDKVIIAAEKIYFRRMKLKCNIKMYNESGEIIATAVASGQGVKRT